MIYLLFCDLLYCYGKNEGIEVWVFNINWNDFNIERNRVKIFKDFFRECGVFYELKDDLDKV